MPTMFRDKKYFFRNLVLFFFFFRIATELSSQLVLQFWLVFVIFILNLLLFTPKGLQKS